MASPHIDRISIHCPATGPVTVHATRGEAHVVSRTQAEIGPKALQLIADLQAEIDGWAAADDAARALRGTPHISRIDVERLKTST